MNYSDQTETLPLLFYQNLCVCVYFLPIVHHTRSYDSELTINFAFIYLICLSRNISSRKILIVHIQPSAKVEQIESRWGHRCCQRTRRCLGNI